MATWQLQTAKAKLSELLRAVREQGPQIISVRGKEEFVVMTKAAADFARPEEEPRSALEAFQPILGLGVDLDIPDRALAERPLPFVADED